MKNIAPQAVNTRASGGFMGPPAFRFTLGAQSITGPAFSNTFKVLATLMVLACGAALFHVWRSAPGAGGVNWFMAGWALMAVTCWHILRSTTRIDAQGLHQRWLWDKHMPLGELAYGKLIRVRGLHWLIAPRLYVRTLDAKFAVFYAASPALLSEFERLCAELKAFRAL